MKKAIGFIALGAVATLLVCMRLFGGSSDTPVELGENSGLMQTTIDFQGAILGESRQQQMYVVLEQDVTVESRISQTVLDLSIFEKSKTLQSFGKGCYAVDLSQLTEESIEVNHTAKTVTVTIPHAILYSVEYDIANSVFTDDSQGLLAFGELKLTLEQTNELQQSIDTTLRASLETKEMFDLADETACEKVQTLFAPVVAALSDAYTLKIKMN